MAYPRRQNPFVRLVESQPEELASLEGDGIAHILDVVRSHLGMDIAFASEFTGGRRVFRHVSASPGDRAVTVGASDPLEASYCQRVVDGRLPELIHDASALPATAALEVTRAFPIGAHMSVPLRLTDGSVYGTFCCFSREADRSLNGRDLKMLRAFAELAAAQIERDLDERRTQEQITARIRDAISHDRLRMVYQPIYRIDDGAPVGVESLARFPDCETRPPSDWFNEAAQVGLGVELDLAAVRQALAGLPYVPEQLYVAINVSPATLLSGELERVLETVPSGRVVVEITEHAAVSDYVGLRRALEPLRKRVRVAVDDVGAGYSGLRHILDLRPDIIKLDMSLTQGIDQDHARAVLAQALVSFASGIGCMIVAEGVERPEELETLRELGVDKAQGYHLSRPLPVMAVRQFLTGARAAGG
jgi:EAL domain-containing protein (putative c-di-GMP-specific phosphodiesterase class I)